MLEDLEEVVRCRARKEKSLRSVWVAFSQVSKLGAKGLRRRALVLTLIRLRGCEECSAKTNVGVLEAFQELVREVSLKKSIRQWLGTDFLRLSDHRHTFFVVNRR